MSLTKTAFKFFTRNIKLYQKTKRIENRKPKLFLDKVRKKQNVYKFFLNFFFYFDFLFGKTLFCLHSVFMDPQIFDMAILSIFLINFHLY